MRPTRSYTDTPAMDDENEMATPIAQPNFLSLPQEKDEAMLEKGALFDQQSVSMVSHTSNPYSTLGSDGSLPGPSLPDLWLHPCLTIHADEVLSNSNNFLPDSDVDVLTVTGPESNARFRQNCRDADVEEAIKSLEGTVEAPAIMVLCVKLDASEHATFAQRASISKPLAGKVFDHFDVHGGFLLDLVGRPNYWSATSQVKADLKNQGEVFEFFCQHPRWHQKGRYDKMKQGATQGNKAPCSLYMSYSVATNTTFYMVVAPDDGVWFSFLDRIQTGAEKGTDSRFSSLLSPRHLAQSPFQVHAMVASIAFEEATAYAATLREMLMTQVTSQATLCSMHGSMRSNRTPRHLAETSQRLLRPPGPSQRRRRSRADRRRRHAHQAPRHHHAAALRLADDQHGPRQRPVLHQAQQAAPRGAHALLRQDGPRETGLHGGQDARRVSIRARLVPVPGALASAVQVKKGDGYELCMLEPSCLGGETLLTGSMLGVQHGHAAR